LPDAARTRILANVPDGWEAVVIGALTKSKGEGSNEVSDETLQAAGTAEAYFGYGLSEALLAAAPRLRWAHSAAAGVGNSLSPGLRQRDIVFTNSAGVYAEPMADTVLGGVLHFARGLDFAVRFQAEQRWEREPWHAADSPVREVSQLTLGIHGLGGIGLASARRALALGMRVVATRRRPAPAPDGIELLTGDDALPRLLARSDVLLVTVPATPATLGSIGPRELELLPPNATVILVSRGGVVDEAALIEALRGGGVRGAALDVFTEEPLPETSPLWGLPNVLITPHISGSTHLFWRRETDLIVENLRRYQAGAPLLNTVDKRAGY
ncbi:MAG TPA: D-2-hydroxyacid dehydrogenase, partial [Longimicrobium sp.]